MITVRLSMPEDVRLLAPRLCAADVQELQASSGSTPEAALTSGLNSPDACLTGTKETGEPILMFGTVPHPRDPSVGLVWLLSSEEVLNHRTDFLRKSRHYMDVFARKYPILMNFTDCRNTVHHRWLRWCGFAFLKTVTGLGTGGHPFYKVARVRSVHV